MIPVKLSQIAAWAGAVCPADSGELLIDDICKDSRAARPGSLFVPLPGTRFDGHDFLPAAVEKGASAALCARPELSVEIPLLRVENTLDACQAIAAGYRSLFTPLVVGITGSVGKTTTALMTAAVLGSRYRLLKTEEDSNGQIGLPFALFRLSPEHEAAVLEMGMSQSGELTRLTRMAKPDTVVINSIGTAHIEFFGTREKICQAKLEILRGLRPGGTVILNGDEPLLWDKRETLGFPTLCYGLSNPAADLRAEILESDGASTVFAAYFRGETCRVRLPAAGAHNVSNALAAILAGICGGISFTDAAAALERYIPARGRQNIYETRGGITIIDDCYNASPEAVCASLAVLHSLTAGRRFAVLGGMLELGDYAEEGHRRCGRCAAEQVDYLYAYGNDAYLEGAREAGMDGSRALGFETHEDLARRLAAEIRPGDAVLFKGSHGMHMEKALSLFLKERMDERKSI